MANVRVANIRIAILRTGAPPAEAAEEPTICRALFLFFGFTSFLQTLGVVPFRPAAVADSPGYFVPSAFILRATVYEVSDVPASLSAFPSNCSGREDCVTPAAWAVSFRRLRHWRGGFPPLLCLGLCSHCWNWRPPGCCSQRVVNPRQVFWPLVSWRNF